MKSKHTFFKVLINAKAVIMLSMIIGFIISYSETKACNASFTYNLTGATIYLKDTAAFDSTAFYTWDFGDGSGGGGQSASHTYTSSGTFIVTYRMTDSFTHCYARQSDTIVVTSVCNAAYTYSYPFNLTVNFSPNNHDAAAKHEWYFGDGDSSSSATPSHSYSLPGYYHICHRMVDGACNQYECDSLYVYGKAGCTTRVYIRAQNGLSLSLAPDTSSSNPNYFHWSFGDGTTSSVEYPSHTYNDSGTYTISYIQSYGTDTCSGSLNVHVDRCYNAAFTYYVYGESFNGSAANPITSGVSFKWYFGDGGTDTGITVHHLYPAKAHYNVKLVVTSGKCTDSSMQSVAASYYSLAGFVSYDSVYKANGKVFLIKYNPADSTLTAVDTFHFNYLMDTAKQHIGFQFDSLNAGNYMVKAAFDSTSDSALYNHSIPTYANNAVNWSNAYTYSLTGSSNYYDATIFMQTGTNPGGPGFIGGKVSQGANKKGDPMGGIQIMLRDHASGAPVAVAYSDVNGNYAFRHLGLTSYDVYAEVIGVQPIPATVILSQAYKGTNYVNITVSQKQVVTSIWQPETIYSVAGYKVYPNPAADQLNITYTNQSTDKMTLTIYNIEGSEVYIQQATGAGPQVLHINTTALQSGMYIVELKDAMNGNISRSAISIAR